MRTMSKPEDYLKEQLTDIAGKPWNQLSHVQETQALSKLFVLSAMPALGHIDAPDLYNEGVVDGAGDLGIDLLIKCGRDVHIIQSKYRGWARTLKREDIDTFQTVLTRLGNSAFDVHMQTAMCFFPRGKFSAFLLPTCNRSFRAHLRKDTHGNLVCARAAILFHRGFFRPDGLGPNDVIFFKAGFHAKDAFCFLGLRTGAHGMKCKQRHEKDRTDSQAGNGYGVHVNSPIVCLWIR